MFISYNHDFPIKQKAAYTTVQAEKCPIIVANHSEKSISVS